MKIIIKGDAKEIAALVVEVQERRIALEPSFVPETADGPCTNRKPVKSTALF